MVGVDEAVIRTIRLIEHRKSIRVLLPGEFAGIDNNSAQRRAVSAHELGERVQHDVRAIIDRP